MVLFMYRNIPNIITVVQFKSSVSDSSSRSSISSDIKLEEDQLNEMLTTLMGEAKQIRGDNQPSTSHS